MDHYHGCIEARCARGTGFTTSETYFHYQQHLKSLHSYWSYQGHFSKSTVGSSSFIVFAIGVEQLHSAVIAPFPSVNLCPFLLLPWARCRYPTPTQNNHRHLTRKKFHCLQKENFITSVKETPNSQISFIGSIWSTNPFKISDIHFSVMMPAEIRTKFRPISQDYIIIGGNTV